MYQFSYLETAEDAASSGRENERHAIGVSIKLLRAALVAGPRSPETVEALYYVRKLWMVLIEDVAGPDNILPIELKAKVISVGLWMIKQADLVSQDKSDSLTGLIDVSEAILEGLK